MCYVQSSIYETVNTKLTSDDKRDGTRAIGCEYKINNG